jgi:hypothetical protein
VRNCTISSSIAFRRIVAAARPSACSRTARGVLEFQVFDLLKRALARWLPGADLLFELPENPLMSQLDPELPVASVCYWAAS